MSTKRLKKAIAAFRAALDGDSGDAEMEAGVALADEAESFICAVTTALDAAETALRAIDDAIEVGDVEIHADADVDAVAIAEALDKVLAAKQGVST
ncbi:MAG TPA: hypothetical protein VEA38_07150 [Terriglobales bacterium]|nr:hypothetical protein [Terriglobales bacterium]